MRSQTIHRLGFWSAVAAFVLSITFIIGAAAGLPKPWDGYSLMMVAAFFTGFAFAYSGIGRWIRWAGIANGLFAIPVFISYVVYSFILGVWWGITIPVFLLLLAIYFWRA